MKIPQPSIFAYTIDIQEIKLQPNTIKKLQSVTTRLKQFSKFMDDPQYNSFGNELKLAQKIQGAKIEIPAFFNTLPKAKFIPRDLRSYFIRPATEPITLSFYQYKEYGLSSEQLFIELSSALLGCQNQFRETDMIGSKEEDGTVVGFVELNKLELSINKYLLDVECSKLLEILIYYMNFLFIHPLKDGNGRTARAIFHIQLNLAFGIFSPFLPIGPWLHYFSRELIQSYKAYFKDKTLDNSLIILLEIITLTLHSQPHIDKF